MMNIQPNATEEAKQRELRRQIRTLESSLVNSGISHDPATKAALQRLKQQLK